MDAELTAGRNLERHREAKKRWYQNLSQEKRDARRKRAAELMRIRRAKLREAGLTSKGKAPVSVSQPAEPAPAIVTPPEQSTAPKSKPAKPQTMKAQDLANYDDVSAQKARTLQKVWRTKVSEYLLDCSTAPESPLTGAGIRSSQMLCFWFGLGAKLDRIVEQDRPEMTQEFTLAVLLECLRRLSGDKPSVSIPVLPGTI